MGAMTVGTVKGSTSLSGRMKMVVVSVAGSTSYATGGDTIDLSTTGTLGAADGFTGVTAVIPGDVAAAADDVYRLQYVGATAATGLIKMRDLAAASDAEVTNATNLSTKTWTLTVFGY
jgi:hypothetical protein